MSRFPCINENHLENIARILGGEITGSKLTDIFKRLSIIDNSGESTKWRRIYHSLLNRQSQDHCGNNIAAFIKTILAPAIAFSLKSPLLAFNTLQTWSEKSEHKGFAQLLKGCFSAIRNPRAHEPKILWQNDEHEAADYLTLISLLYRKLDNAILIPQVSHTKSHFKSD